MKKCCSLITLGDLDAAVVGEEWNSQKYQAFLEGGMHFKTVDSGDMVLKLS